MNKKKLEKSVLTLEEQSELVVKVFQVSLDTLEDQGLSEEDSLNGILSQLAILVEPESLTHALELNKKFRAAYLSQGEP
ncbi:MAG: hypothetical protein CML37_04415 [Rhodobacteraceae bacterium]|nr:hypothetical protein [Paracoccaceae bacterium]